MMTAQRFETEKALQDYCLMVLRSKGIQAKEEVWNGSIRADIVTSTAVIELKKVLNREALYQALGQAKAYQNNLGKKEIWIVGQYPQSSTEKEQAIKIARELEKDETVIVSFIDDDEFWTVKNSSEFSLETWRLMCLLVGVIMIIFAYQGWVSRKCPAPLTPQQVSQALALHRG
jgi:hypothetical protein